MKVNTVREQQANLVGAKTSVNCMVVNK